MNVSWSVANLKCWWIGEIESIFDEKLRGGGMEEEDPVSGLAGTGRVRGKIICISQYN